MRLHENCGAEVIWARMEDDESRFLPPLEYAGHFIFIQKNDENEKIAIERVGYRIHECDPDAVEVWQKRLARLEKVSSNKTHDQEVIREAQRDSLWDIASLVGCETCGAGAQVHCHNLSKGKNYGTKVKNPHPRRLADAYALLESQEDNEEDITRG